jgi:MSHA biogenesis protein MshG
MPTFRYKARTSTGALITGSIDAVDSWLARKAVARLDLTVVDLTRQSLNTRFEVLFTRFNFFGNPVSLEEQLVFISQLETGFGVGIPVLRVFELSLQDLKNPRLKAAIQDISSRVAQGMALHEAFAKHPSIFDETFVGLIRAGEISGELEKVLHRIFKITEQKSENQARVKSAMFYPKIVVGFMVAVVLGVVYYVIPKIRVFLDSFGQDLPPITKVVIGFSDFVTRFGVLLIPLAWGLWFFFRNWTRTPKGSILFDRFKLQLPALGILFLQLELCTFCVVLELLLESGVPIAESLETLSQSLSNRVIRRQLTEVKAEVISGKSLHHALSSKPVFPSSLTNLIGIGEEAGRIPDVLKRVGRHYQLQVDYRLNNLSKLIEPILLSIIFVFTLILALAVFLPIWKMSSAVKMNH